MPKAGWSRGYPLRAADGLQTRSVVTTVGCVAAESTQDQDAIDMWQIRRGACKVKLAMLHSILDVPFISLV